MSSLSLSAVEYLSVPTIAKRYGIDPVKVRIWIDKGLLDAVDVSTPGSQRRQWRVHPNALRRFEELRSGHKTNGKRKPSRPKKRATKDYTASMRV